MYCQRFVHFSFLVGEFYSLIISIMIHFSAFLWLLGPRLPHHQPALKMSRAEPRVDISGISIFFSINQGGEIKHSLGKLILEEYTDIQIIIHPWNRLIIKTYAATQCSVR